MVLNAVSHSCLCGSSTSRNQENKPKCVWICRSLQDVREKLEASESAHYNLALGRPKKDGRLKFMIKLGHGRKPADIEDHDLWNSTASLWIKKNVNTFLQRIS